MRMGVHVRMLPIDRRHLSRHSGIKISRFEKEGKSPFFFLLLSASSPVVCVDFYTHSRLFPRSGLKKKRPHHLLKTKKLRNFIETCSFPHRSKQAIPLQLATARQCMRNALVQLRVRQSSGWVYRVQRHH